MARQEVKITYLDGKEANIKVSPRAEVATERKYGIGVGQMLKEERAEHIYHLTWASLKFGASKISHDFEEWLDSVEDVEFLDDDKDENEPDDTEDPTQDSPLTTTS
ncbi:MAG TPA: hypothetical protein VHV10_04735 [Ktedonobacteraceae bacterium]|nr:hypothetical protein [Ktedonobacteraceae bacterium]